MWQELARECDLSHVETWGHTQNWLDTSLIVKCQKTCRICRKQIAQGKHEYIGVPKMLVLTLEDVPHAIADPIIKIHAAGNGIQEFKLSGIIYFGREHFTARVVDKSQRIWYQDGLMTRRECLADGQLNEISHQDMWYKEGCKASAGIYSLTKE